MKLHTIYLIFLFIFLTSCSTDAELAFQDWDENKDGVILEGEYYEMKPYLNLFQQWDVNNNSFVNEEEWSQRVNDFYPEKNENEYGSFSNWDTDSDGSIDSGEFAQKTFNLWDMNDDNKLDMEEFEEWYPEYKFAA
ncbi:MAG: EF-hand domain-containing protein [Candidatus Cyclobacteriaceae bacterium M2_1C_046]